MKALIQRVLPQLDVDADVVAVGIVERHGVVPGVELDAHAVVDAEIPDAPTSTARRGAGKPSTVRDGSFGSRKSLSD